MAFKYSCFISYRHGKYELLNRMAVDFEEALGSELEALTDLPIYVDTTMRGGDFYNPLLATALCESVCMIMHYIPQYFSSTHNYCAREYKAMEKLEAERLNLLDLPPENNRGLIIPVVFRGPDRLPREIKGKRHYYNFSNFLAHKSSRKLGREYAEEMKAMAEYIAERCNAFAQISPAKFRDCSDFSLPAVDEIKDWLKNVEAKNLPFPI